jgi:lipid A 3-O-deacylase
MASVRRCVQSVALVLLGSALAYGQEPMPMPKQMPKSSTPATSKISPITPVPGTIPPRKNELGNWQPEVEPKEEAPIPPHLQIIPQWYPSPPPANYSSSSCNFNVWCGENRFSPDFSTQEVRIGGYTTFPGFGPRIRNFSYVPLSVRHGWMLNAPQDIDSLYRGNFEVLFDVTAACITSGLGKGFIGPSILWRYNFVQPGASVVPYLQGGSGFVLTDAYKDRTQRAIGQAFEFYLRAEVGARFFLTDNWSFDIEGGYQHISNARMAERNYGVNALGAQIGFTYFFPSGGR